jgi:HEAT repeats
VTDRREGIQRPTWHGRGSSGGQIDEAVTYIERLKDRPAEEAVPKLLEVLRDESWFLRDRAGKALVSYGDEAVGAIELLVKDGLWYTRAAAIRTLGRIGAPQSLIKLFDNLDDSNRTVAEETAKALLDYCSHNRSLSIAKVLHGRGQIYRDKIVATMLHLDPDGGEKVRRLIGEKALMGPEGSLRPDEEGRLLVEIADSEWQIHWSSMTASQPIPEPSEHLIHYLRGDDPS